MLTIAGDDDALGALVHEMLVSSVHRHVRYEIERTLERIDAALAAATHPDPTRRTSSAGELAEAVSSALPSESPRVAARRRVRSVTAPTPRRSCPGALGT